MIVTLFVLSIAHGTIGVKNSLYNHVYNSMMTNGQACFGDCIDNQCVYDWQGNLYSCDVSEVRSPVFKTLKNTDCYSNCGYNGEKFLWCATLEGHKIRWEHCTRYEATTATKQTQTESHSYTCKDDCKSRGSSYNWCHTHNSWEKCDPERWVLVFNYPTENFDDVCITPCIIYGGVRKCYDKKEKWVSCYLNADKSLIIYDFGQSIHKALRNFGALDTSNSGEGGYEVCSSSSYRKKKRATNSQWPHIACVRDLVLEYESAFPTIFPNDGGPVQSYTVTPIQNPGGDDTIIPLAIRAVITRAHLRAPGTRGNIPATVTRNVENMNPFVMRRDGNDDERGHLLASALGGAMEPYNFIPQPRLFNRGRGSRWPILEGVIARFLRDSSFSGRYVEWQMALSYDAYSNRPLRPICISLNVRMYEADGRLNNTSGVYENMYFSNDPLWLCTAFAIGSG